mmetsp:Transcript_37378/g.110338  ORF Transcript_37378/g.110338 Transcript_37378/m.110338 type:complete len:233 (-) Transcript_37378:589-1287(-)
MLARWPRHRLGFESTHAWALAPPRAWPRARVGSVLRGTAGKRVATVVRVVVRLVRRTCLLTSLRVPRRRCGQAGAAAGLLRGARLWLLRHVWRRTLRRPGKRVGFRARLSSSAAATAGLGKRVFPVVVVVTNFAKAAADRLAPVRRLRAAVRHGRTAHGAAADRTRPAHHAAALHAAKTRACHAHAQRLGVFKQRGLHQTVAGVKARRHQRRLHRLVEVERQVRFVEGRLHT